jgi:hypothetical protein
MRAVGNPSSRLTANTAIIRFIVHSHVVARIVPAPVTAILAIFGPACRVSEMVRSHQAPDRPPASVVPWRRLRDDAPYTAERISAGRWSSTTEGELGSCQPQLQHAGSAWSR